MYTNYINYVKIYEKITGSKLSYEDDEILRNMCCIHKNDKYTEGRGYRKHTYGELGQIRLKNSIWMMRETQR